MAAIEAMKNAGIQPNPNPIRKPKDIVAYIQQPKKVIVPTIKGIVSSIRFIPR